MSMSPFSLAWLALTLGVVGCTTYHHPSPTEAKEAIKDAHAQSTALQVPDAVQAELLPPSTLLAPPATVVNERRFHVQAKDVEANAFFASLMQDARYSVAVHPGVAGRISLDLKEVTLPEVLDTVASMYGFDIRRQGNVYHVYPAGLRTENFPVNYLMFTRQGASRTSITSGGVTEQSGNAKTTTGSSTTSSSTSNTSASNNNGNGTTIETGSQSDFWKELTTALQQLVGSGEGRAVIVNPQASLVTVRAMPDEMAAVKAFLDQSQQQLTRQVILEAKIVEVRLNEGFQQGVEWGKLSAQWSSGKGITSAGSLVGLPAVTNSVVNALGGGAGLQFSDGNFDMVVNLLKSQGDVNTLSSPRVTATNNQKAVIKVGNDEYFVTNVSSNTVTSSSASVVSPNIELTPFFSGVALDVLPQIDGEGNVLLHIHPAVIDVTEQQKTITLGSSGTAGTSSTYTLPLAYSDIRESDTVVRAKSGDVIVIGGLMRTNKEQKVSKVPLLGDIPLFGEAFTNRQDATTKTELVIMLKPQVVQSDTWRQELQRSSQLLEKWYPQER